MNIRLTVNYVDANIMLQLMIGRYTDMSNYANDPHMVHKVYWINFLFDRIVYEVQ